MATELVNSATSEKLPEMDWTRSIEICELISRDQRQAREVIKAIKKRLGSKHANVQLFAVMLLEILMNNLGDEVHKQVIDVGLLPLLVKIVKKKSDLPVREKIFLLLDATQTATGGGSGKFPQYYEAYYDLVNAGVKFPDRPQVVAVTVSNQVSSNNKKHSPSNHHGNDGIPPPAKPLPEAVPASSTVEKASAVLEVLREVLDAVDPHHPESAKDEFTLDLVEQCSFQQQKVMHLVVTSRDDKVVSIAIDLNEQLQKLLARHDELISGKIPTSSSNHHTHEDADEEEVEQLVRRMRKGKACMQHEEEDHHRRQKERPFGLLGGGTTNINRPIIRPLSIDEPQEQQQQQQPIHPPAQEEQQQQTIRPGVSIPPPPAKHVEREKFFQEKKVDGSSLTNHVRGLSLHSRNGSSSYSVGSDDSD